VGSGILLILEVLRASLTPNYKSPNHRSNVGPLAEVGAVPLRRQQLIFLAVFRASRSIAAGLIALAFPYLV